MENLEPRLNSRLTTSSLFLGLVSVLMLLSSVVIIEPAPYELILTGLILLALIGFRITFTPSLTVPSALLALFTFANLISMYFAQDIVRGVRYFVITAYLAVSWYFFAWMLGKFRMNGMSVIFTGYALTALFSATIGILGFFQLVPFSELLLKYGRITGFFKDPNVFGPFLVPVSMLALFKIKASEGKGKVFWMTTFLITSFGVLLSMSRAAWANYAMTLVLSLAMPNSLKLKHKLLLVVAVVIMVLIGGLYLMNDPTLSTLLAARMSLQSYGAHRFGTQLTALETAMEHPLGAGPGQADVIFWMSTHSLYMRILVENGWFALVAFLCFVLTSIGRAFWIALRSAPQNKLYFTICFAALVGLMLNSFVIDSLHWRHFWLLLALPWVPYAATVSHHPR